jgi:hypothetical protein
MTEPANPEPQPITAEEIQADIEQTRERLAESVDALADKANVKARAQEKVDETKQRARERVEQTRQQAVVQTRLLQDRFKTAPRPVQIAVVAVPAALIVVALVVRAIRNHGPAGPN